MTFAKGCLRRRVLGPMAVLGLSCAAVVFGMACQSVRKIPATGPAAQGADLNLALLPIKERGGAQLWGDNCARCHNSRPPSEFSDDQWEVITHHMRVRANLTAYEHDMILKFLQSAN